MEELSRGIKKYFELNDNENTNYHNLQGKAKAVHTGKFTALNALLDKKKDMKSIIYASRKGHWKKNSKLNKSKVILKKKLNLAQQ